MKQSGNTAAVRWQVLYVPLLLSLAILLVDKVALIPAVRDAGRKPPTPMDNIRRAIHLSRAAKANDPRPEVVVLGTSRTKYFQYLHPDTIRQDDFTDARERRQLLGMRFETGTILPAAEMLVQYVYVKEYLRSKPRPELVVLEVSPAAFNRHSQNNMELFLYGNVYDYSLLWELAQVVQWDRLSLVGTKLAFASYAYGFRPENALRNLIRGQDYRHSAEMAMKLIMLQPRTKPIPPNYVDQPAAPVDSKDYRARITNYTDYVQKHYLRRFSMDDAELELFARILKQTKKAGQPIVLWRPRVHPSLQQRTGELGLTKAFQAVENLIRREELPYYDASADADFRCRRYTDSSHLSARCQPFLMSRILATAARAYPKARFAQAR